MYHLEYEMHGKLILNFYLHLIFKHKILIK